MSSAAALAHCCRSADVVFLMKAGVSRWITVIMYRLWLDTGRVRTKFFNPFKFGDLHKWRILVTWYSAVWYDKLVLSTYFCIPYQVRSNELLALFLLFWILGALSRVIYCIFFFLICAVYTVDLHLLGFGLSLGKFSNHCLIVAVDRLRHMLGMRRSLSMAVRARVREGERVQSAQCFSTDWKVSLVSSFYRICVYSMALKHWQS